MSDSMFTSGDLGSGVRGADVTPAWEIDPFRPPLDCLVAMRPFGHKMTRMASDDGFGKDVESIDVYTIVVMPNGEYVDLGMRDLSWKFVMRELDKATPEAPWVVGTITRKRAYVLGPPNPEEMKRAVASITSLLEDRSKEDVHDDEPF